MTDASVDGPLDEVDHDALEHHGARRPDVLIGEVVLNASELEGVVELTKRI